MCTSVNQQIAEFKITYFVLEFPHKQKQISRHLKTKLKPKKKKKNNDNHLTVSAHAIDKLQFLDCMIEQKQK